MQKKEIEIERLRNREWGGKKDKVKGKKNDS